MLLTTCLKSFFVNFVCFSYLSLLLLSSQNMLLQPGELEELMHMAITTNRVDFVRLFLEHGVSLREFLTVKRLLQLYNDVRFKLCLTTYYFVFLLVAIMSTWQ